MSEEIVIKTAHDAEHDAEHPIETTEHALGAVENEIEHHKDDLEKHDGRIETIEGLQKWTDERIQELQRTIAETPKIPQESLDLIMTEIRELREKVEKPIVESTQSLTEPPPQEENGKKNETPERRHLLDRIL